MYVCDNIPTVQKQGGGNPENYHEKFFKIQLGSGAFSKSSQKQTDNLRKKSEIQVLKKRN